MNERGLDKAETQTGEPVPGRLARSLSLASNLLILILATAFIALVGGFGLFVGAVANLAPPVDPKADAIVVLTGGYQRIDQAVQLLAEGAGRRLLISGVNRSTTLDQIRRFTRAPETLFECCVDIGYDALDTAGNAEEAARWIKARGFASVIVVTNNYHMPRSMVELRRADPATRYIAFPVEGGLSLSELAGQPYIILVLGSEYLKTLMAYVRDYVPMPDVH